MELKDLTKSLPKVSARKHVDTKLIWAFGLFGLVVVAIVIWLVYNDWRMGARASDAVDERQQALEQIGQPVQSFKRVLQDPQVQALAARAIADSNGAEDLLAYIKGRVGQAVSAEVYPADTSGLYGAEMGPNGYALLDMVMSSLEGQVGLMQIHYVLQPPVLYDAALVRSEEETLGVLIVGVDPEFLLAGFEPRHQAGGFLRLTQYNGREQPSYIREWGDPGLAGEVPERTSIYGSRFRFEYPSPGHIGLIGGLTLLLMLTAGLSCILAAVVLHRMNQNWKLARRKERALRERQKAETTAVAERPSRRSAPAPEAGPSGKSGAADADESTAEALVADPPPMRLQYNIAERRRMREAEHQPVELTPGIFRAYDIRGVIDKTLDSGVARQVGRAIGTLALESDAAPVVVARDGRLSGPYLMEGMIDGITSTGCDVLDIGAVPTGVLYYAAHELAAGSGVMITGSHNPPDYNGFKIMIAGDTLHGEAISGIYTRISLGELASGEGNVTRKNVVPSYIQRIADDIKIDRELKIVIDCGNGIGGVCAADTLRAVGVEVLPLFDEVDGTFPNHHPDPSEPENLQDLIESVRLMDADLGLAFDGDADRLGVVTLAGDIIFPDRVMMLLALDVLQRNPGATIIYDVKCTGHLPRVIREAGGNPMMYKTGHSLIKAKMKEVGSPFAGEMSGHFFFAERWYGVDDGIYAAARLLEILAGTETPPEAILNALPSSYGTPELKVQMEEGENHAFIEAFRAAASFDGAEVSTIDGLRADFEDGWGLVRASNTTPILVVRFDADTQGALERIKSEFKDKMLAVNPNLDLPF